MQHMVWLPEHMTPTTNQLLLQHIYHRSSNRTVPEEMATTWGMTIRQRPTSTPALLLEQPFASGQAI
jgi:hypothetical protein